MATPGLIAFGAISQRPTSERLDEIRAVLQQQPSLTSTCHTLQGLKSLWKTLVNQDPCLESLNGLVTATQLSDWITGSISSKELQDNGNVMQIPLTTLAHISQYVAYLRQGEESHEDIVESVALGGGVQGLCVGLLSALAVASAATEHDLGIMTATSVRLAFCVGAYVDLDCRRRGQHSQTTTLAVRWKAPTTLDDVEELVDNYSDTYIAVRRDARDATIVTTSTEINSLLEDFSHMNITFIDAGVSAQYHAAIHHGTAEKILNVCNPVFTPSLRGKPLVRSNTDASPLADDKAAQSALESILVDRADWYSTISTAADALIQAKQNSFALSIGTDAIPHSVARTIPVVRAKRFVAQVDKIAEAATAAENSVPGYPKDAIAIIGMSGRFPGADNVEEYWDLLTAGKIMFSKAPEARFGPSARTTKGQPFWGNFLANIEDFDHSFFKRSPREAASTDPQQRLLLELAYESLESSGYFAGASRAKDVGVYIGSNCTDYDFNVASHPATAYSAIGTLRSFMSGKLSHYFGWYGPSLVIDTACSASAVAIHTACTALRTGQCSQALAGGVNMMTAPYIYENFAAAHFLTPTGASKSFGADADGYCRGEGGGLIVLKLLSDALRDDDNILGVIGGIALNQNDNCVPITVPHSTSQGSLYEQVCRQAEVTARDVSFVEAHGTGTPVGDPIEMQSIRRVFGAPDRDSPLFVSSVKANIGHLEAASGVSALIKSILQIEHRLVPRLPTFKTLNPKIPELQPDNLCVPTSNTPLTGQRLVACVNNYGAAGSNAAMIIIEPPRKTISSRSGESGVMRGKFPIMLTAASGNSLLAYCSLLDKMCEQLRTLEPEKNVDALPSLAYSLSKRLNQDLACSLTFTASDLDELQQQIREQTPKNNRIKLHTDREPVVLCFGGQVSDKVGMDKQLWQECALLRNHLDICDSVITSLGYPSIYPAVFEKNPITDVVTLHAVTFATQYASAQAWLESGLHVDAVIGHSFGQLTALCVSGMLSVQDGVRLVLGRATLMKRHWGEEPGTMVLVQADQQTLEHLRTNGHDFEVACFNGPSAHVIVSDTESGERIVAALKERSIKHKRLEVAYGFHSRFTQPLLPHLKKLASELVFHNPKILVETCTNMATWSEPSPERIVAHTREPVYFAQAVERLQHKFGACTWVEAGSGSGILTMAKAALGSYASNSTYVPLSLDKPNSSAALADTTITLWNTGQSVKFWNFCKLQHHQYDRIWLPPYAWDRTRHWLPLKMCEALGTTAPSTTVASTTAPPADLPPVLIRLESTNLGKYYFAINPSSEQYRYIVGSVKVTGTNNVPAAFYIEIVYQAITLANGGNIHCPLSLENLDTSSPPELAPEDPTHLELQRDSSRWSFRVMSGKGRCAEGAVQQQQKSSSLQDEFNRYERLLSYDDVISIFEDPRSQSVRGSVVYKLLSRTTSYPKWYHGVTSVATLGYKIAARVIRPSQTPPTIVTKESQTEIVVLESILQVIYLHANCLQESTGEEVYRLGSLQRLQFAPHFQGQALEAQTSWTVLAITAGGGSQMSYDVFVYDEQRANLALVMLGVCLTSAGALVSSLPALVQQPTVSTPKATIEAKSTIVAPEATKEQENSTQSGGKDAKSSIFEDICGLLETLADIPADEITNDASFDDLGVDSLMVIEVVSELQSMFKVEMPLDEMEQLTDLDSLVHYLDGKGAVGSSYVEGAGSDSSSASVTSRSTAPSTPPEPEELNPEQQWRSETPKSVASEVLDLGSHGIQDAFSNIRLDFERHAAQTGATAFWSNVYPDQNDVVTGFVCDAYRKLDCDLSTVEAGQVVPQLTKAQPQHEHLLAQLRNILTDSGLLELSGLGTNQQLIRTSRPVNSMPTETLYKQFLQHHPAYVPDIKCLQLTAPLLAECLTGQKKPAHLLFGNARNYEILANFYAKSPLLDAACRMLAEFVASLPSVAKNTGPLQILEVGAGTGGTTKYIVDYLNRQGVEFEYTFTDISQSLVNQAKRSFKHHSNMQFRRLDADSAPPPDLVNQFHLVLSTNCIHATSSIEKTTANISKVIRSNGALCVLEVTKNIYWFDLVFGLLEGWWLMADGRTHALAPTSFWDRSLRSAGYKDVSWTSGDTEEANTVRLICGFKNERPGSSEIAGVSQPQGRVIKRAGMSVEEIVYKSVDGLDLLADIYFPKEADRPGKKRAVALLIHGGGHFLFGRKDVPMKHIRILLQRGFLPVSIDYRLVPETTLFEGPMTDCCDALQWARETLPTLSLSGSGVHINSLIMLAIGWSSGGQLAMSLGYTAPQRGFKAPEAIFALYPPSDFEAEHWHKPCYPLAAEEEPQEIKDILAGVRQSPILDYAPVSDKRTMALSLTLKDPRAKIILHTCWNSQTLPILVNGLPHKDSVADPNAKEHMYPPAATDKQVHDISPLWQIRQGNYRTPTFIVHGNGDDWLPHSMSERTIRELKNRGIPAGLTIPEKCSHAFDLFPVGDPLSTGWPAIVQGYDFIYRLLNP
ncbi:Nn.00g105470.m01.CDS01 [Neocucurbitaria sp. VM-36]